MSVIQTSKNQGQNQRDLDARAVTLVGAISVTLSVPIILYFALQTRAWQLFAYTADLSALATAAWGSVLLVRRGRTEQGINILLWTAQAAFIIASLLIAGTGLVFGLGAMLGVVIITAQVIPPERSQTLLISGVVSGLAAFVIDAFDPSNRFPVSPTLEFIFIGVIGAVILIFLFFFIRRFSSYPIQIKLLAASIGLIATPLMVFGYIQTRSVRNQTIIETGNELTTLSNQAALTLDSFFNTNLAAIRIEAQQPVFANYLISINNIYINQDTVNETVDALRILAKKDPTFISSYALLDIHGTDRLDSDTTQIDQDESQQEYFKSAVSGGLPYGSSLLYQTDTGSSALYFSAPVRDARGTPIGVLRVRYSGAIIQQIIAQYNLVVKADSYAAVIDENHVFVAHGLDPQLILKSAEPLPPSLVKDLQNSGRLPPGTPAEIYANLPGLAQGVQGLIKQPIFTAQLSQLSKNTDYVASSSMKSKHWTVLFAEPQNEFLSTVRSNTLATALLVSLVTLLSVLGTFVLARAIAIPISHLTDTASIVAQGNLETTAKIETDDEVGTLAKAFNSMTSEIRDLVGTLEQRVADRTRDLEKQANRLRVAAEVARDAASARNLDELLERSARLILDRFSFYHSGIFLLDDKKEYAVLRASPTDAGRIMMTNKHRLRVGEQGIVGYVAGTGSPRIALDTGADAVYFNNPVLPATRSELALPLKTSEGVIGVLDVQSELPNAFAQDDIETLQVMADQLATAIEKNQLLSQVETSLREMERTNAEFTGRAWKDFLKSHGQAVGYKFDNVRLEPVNAISDVKKGKAQHAVIPIRLRGQTIGGIQVQFQSDQPSEKIKTMIDQVADRLAMALESARLYDEAQARVAKEQAISAITTKIGASINLRNILQTAVEELGQALPGSNVVIQLEPDNKKEN